MERITRKHLEAKIEQLSKALKRPTWSYQKNARGRWVAVPGSLSLDYANIGNRHPWQIQEMINEGGGVALPFGEYRMTAWECYHALTAAIAAVEMYCKYREEIK